MNEKLKPIFRMASIISGSFISALGISELIIPNHLLSGGVGGIAIIIQYMTGISAGVLILISNIPIFIVGIREIDRDFIIHSFIGTISLSIFLMILKNVQLFNFLRIDDIMLSCILGGVLNGIGCGIVFKNRGSMGGSDIIAVIVKKYRSVNIGTVLFIINIFIIIIASTLYGIKLAMYTLISMYISSYLIDTVQEGFDRKKSVFIITEKEDEVASAILKSLNRGVTFLHGEGGYSSRERRVIYCIITTKQLAQLKHIVQALDEKAFLTVSDTIEVLGKGFKSPEI